MGIPSVQAWNETRRPSEVDESNGPISSVGAWNDVTSHRHKSQGVGLKKKTLGVDRMTPAVTYDLFVYL